MKLLLESLSCCVLTATEMPRSGAVSPLDCTIAELPRAVRCEHKAEHPSTTSQLGDQRLDATGADALVEPERADASEAAALNVLEDHLRDIGYPPTQPRDASAAHRRSAAARASGSTTAEDWRTSSAPGIEETSASRSSSGSATTASQ